jgi:HTH-type transcriptional repressor of NAD biosynthesis genes
MHFSSGFVIGKFCPPHLGHDHLIQIALKETERLIIIVCGKKDQAIDPVLRKEWLEKSYPTAIVRLLDQDSFDDTNEEAWTNATRNVLGEVPEAMFTSEAYGEHYAALLGCQHVLVDHERITIPISASKILADPVTYQEFLLPLARSYFLSQERP